MKRQIISFGLMLAAAFTLTNCAKEIANPNEQLESAGVPFEIVATTVDTKTVNDGMSTTWSAGDAINLFHAASGTEIYTDNGSFSISAEDLTAGKFKGTLNGTLDEQSQYDWYAFYPYSSYIKTPANTSKGYMPVGAKSGANQEQVKNNSMAHISGDNYPIVGHAVAVSGTSTPNIQMFHVTSLLEIVVTNTVDTPLLVENISFTAPDNIVGTYFIDFTSDITPESFTDSGESYVSKIANLEVKEGTALAKGQSAKFYLAVKPFKANSGDKLVITVNDDCAKEISLNSEISFNAGKIKTLNFSYDKLDAPTPENASVTEFVFLNKGYENAEEVTSIEEKPIEIAVDKGSGSTTPKYYDTGKAIRVYAGNNLTISAENGKIVKVEFTFATGEGTNAIIADSGNYESNTWVGDCESVKFTVDGTSGHRRIATIKVTYIVNGGETPSPEVKTLESIAVYDAKTNYQVGQEFVVPTVTASYVGGSTANVTATFSGYDLSQTGTQTVMVSYTENGVTKETSYEITVSEIPEVTVAEFIAAKVDESVYYTLRGTITSVANTTYGNFNLTDDTGTVYIYGLYSADGKTNKYWTSSGAKLGDDIIITVTRGEYNNDAQGANARFVELVSPGTRAFYKLSTTAVDFASTGGEQVVAVSAYNTDATVTASSDNPLFVVTVDGYNVTISSAANELEEVLEGNVSVKVGDLEATVVKVALAAKPAAGTVEGGQDDFHTISSTNTNYVQSTTASGWVANNCAVFEGGTSNSSPAFIMIGDSSNRAFCMNGKTSAVGSITSPILTTGCGILKFNYGLPFSDTKIKFSVKIIQNGTSVKEIIIDNSSASKLTKYSHDEEINVAGDFQIVFTNMSPSNSASNKDRTAVWDIEWTGYAN